MKDMAYTPADITVSVGDTIEWVNPDTIVHTVTAPSQGWDENVFPKKTQKEVVKTAGKIEYNCQYHPKMHGTITVMAADGK